MCFLLTALLLLHWSLQPPFSFANTFFVAFLVVCKMWKFGFFFASFSWFNTSKCVCAWRFYTFRLLRCFMCCSSDTKLNTLWGLHEEPTKKKTIFSLVSGWEVICISPLLWRLTDALHRVSLRFWSPRSDTDMFTLSVAPSYQRPKGELLRVNERQSDITRDACVAGGEKGKLIEKSSCIMEWNNIFLKSTESFKGIVSFCFILR